MKTQIDRGGRTRPKWRDVVGDFQTGATVGADLNDAWFTVTVGLTEFDKNSRREAVHFSMSLAEARELVERLQDHISWAESVGKK